MQMEIISALRHELEQQVDEHTIRISQSYFKERVKFYGVKTAAVNQIARQSFLKVKLLEKEEIFDLAEDLFQSDYNEEAFIASEWVYRIRDRFQPDDMIRFETWIDRYINNWAKCDSFCNHAVGAFIDRYPEFLKNLKRWATSENRWLRRASAVTLIIPARKGKFLLDVFEIVDILLLDQENLVQKGYGWMLKEASKVHQEAVFNYILRNKARMPRTALRYAIEKMPEGLRRTAMEKEARCQPSL